LWEAAGLQSVATQATRRRLCRFRRFWESNSAPVGLAGNAINKLSPPQGEELRSLLREQLPAGPDGRISYEAFANAVKGRAPG
jgi:hypothetical protein